MDKILNVIGIILVMIGTVFSLWSILSTKEKYYDKLENHSHVHANGFLTYQMILKRIKRK